MVDPLSGRCAFSDETLPEQLPAEPFGLLMEWMRLAAGEGGRGQRPVEPDTGRRPMPPMEDPPRSDRPPGKVQPNPNAMTLATVDRDGTPSVRVVLARGVDAERGFVTLYTNYTSRKGRAIGQEPGSRVALGFFWDDLDRQVCIEGRAAVSPAWESDKYFNARPVASRIAAWASNQSEPLTSREQLLKQNNEAEERFGYREGMSEAELARIVVPRPAHWGGIRVYAERVQLWLGHSHRLHDRARWTRTLTAAQVDGVEGFVGGAWSAGRLQP